MRMRYSGWDKITLTYGGLQNGEEFCPPADYPEHLQYTEGESDKEHAKKSLARIKYQIAHRFDFDWYLIQAGYVQSLTRKNTRDDQDRTQWAVWGVPREGTEIPEGAIRYRDWEKVAISIVDPGEEDEPLHPPVDIPDDVDEEDEAEYALEHLLDEDWYLMSVGFAQSHTRRNPNDEPDDQDRTLFAIWGVPKSEAKPQQEPEVDADDADDDDEEEDDEASPDSEKQ